MLIDNTELIFGLTPCPFRFSTKYQDDESDLLYYGYRFLNTSTGRWLSRDPIGEKGGINVYCLLNNSTLSRVDRLGLDGPDVPLPNEWANALAWLLSQIVDAQYYEFKITHNVTCPAGSSKYLLSKQETKVENISSMSITMFGWDVPMTTYKVITPVSHTTIETYGCCGGCGFFTSNTNPWFKKNQDTYNLDHVSSAEFGPFEAEIGMQVHTSVKNEVRTCKQSVAPLSSWDDVEFPKTLK